MIACTTVFASLVVASLIVDGCHGLVCAYHERFVPCDRGHICSDGCTVRCYGRALVELCAAKDWASAMLMVCANNGRCLLDSLTTRTSSDDLKPIDASSVP